MVVDTFRIEVESLHTRWKEIKGGPQGTAKAPQTPLWEYYQPILEALVDLDGAARIAEIESAVGLLMKDRLVEGDLSIRANGRARWQVMIRRARKHIVKERPSRQRYGDGLEDHAAGTQGGRSQEERKGLRPFPTNV